MTEALAAFSEDSSIRFTDRLAAFSEEFPAIKERRGPLELAGQELIRDLVIAPPFFGSEHDSLLLASMADRYDRLRIDTAAGRLSPDQHDQEAAFIKSGILLTAGGNAGNTGSQASSNAREYGSSRKLLQIYDDIKNPDLQARVQEEIENNGLFNSPRERLGIHDSHEEDPFEVHVLDIIDIEPNTDPRIDPVRFANTQLFLSSIGYKSTPGVAWVSEIDGISHLAIPYLVARNLFSDDDAVASRTKAMLRHEYVHTQKWREDRDLYTSLEEHRANTVSGDTQGYENERYYFGEIKKLGGFDVVGALVEKQRRGERRPTIHREIVHALGLGALADIALATPATRERTPNLSGDIVDYMQKTGLAPNLLAHTLRDTGISADVIGQRKREYDAPRYPIFSV